jgi:prophage tail gpP-like protein
MSNGDPLVVGRVHEMEIELDADNHEVRITGKSKGSDMVKSSVDHKTHEWRDRTLIDIANDVDSSGIGYESDEPMEPIKGACRCNVGATQLQLLGSLAEKQGLFICANDSGGVSFTRHGKKRHAGGIIEGDNFKKGTAKFSSEDRAEETVVKGHAPSGTGEGNVRHEHREKDAGGRPGTRKVIIPRTIMSRIEARKLAEHVADSRWGDSVQLHCELQGFRDQGGVLWRPGWLAWCEVPSCFLEGDLAIKDLEFSQDDGGSRVIMTLVNPSALGGKASKRSAKAKGPAFKWAERTK